MRTICFVIAFVVLGCLMICGDTIDDSSKAEDGNEDYTGQNIVPQNFQAFADSSKVMLKWEKPKVENLKNFILYYGTSKLKMTGKIELPPQISSYTLTSLTNGTMYYFQISSVLDDRSESRKSKIVFAVPTVPPVIKDIQIFPSISDTEIIGGSKLILKARCYDPDGDSSKLVYDWSSKAGAFLKKSYNSVVWETPLEPGDYSITLKIADENESVNTRTIIITVHRSKGFMKMYIDNSIRDDLKDVFIVDKNTAWAVGSNGIILKYQYGKWFEDENSKFLTNETLNSVYFISDSEGWACGNDGTILHYINDAWFSEDIKTKMDLKALDFFISDEYYVGFCLGTNLLTKRFELFRLDYEDIWKRICYSESSIQHSLSVLNEDIVFFGGKNGEVHYFDGLYCNLIGKIENGISKIAIVNENTLHIANFQQGGIAVYTNSLSRKSNLETPCGNVTWKDIFMLDNEKGFSIGSKGSIAHFFNSKWSRYPQSGKLTKTSLNGIHFLDSHHGMIAGDNAIILQYIDSE